MTTIEREREREQYSSLIKFGLLSTIDSPLLPFFLSAVLSNGIKNICVICDSKTMSEKDKKIWLDRTGGAFENVDNGNANIYGLAKEQIPFYFVENHNSQNTLDLINNKNIGCLFNAGTPRKLSTNLISSVKHGVVNIHPGMLPNYRGCSAVEWAIFNDDKVGNTAHFMSEGYDTGPIITSEWYEFPKDTDYQSIRIRVYREACVLAGKVLYAIQKNQMTPSDGIIQNEIYAKYWDPIPDDKFESVISKVAEKKYKYQLL